MPIHASECKNNFDAPPRSPAGEKVVMAAGARRRQQVEFNGCLID
jgi:hypothetical protein